MLTVHPKAPQVSNRLNAFFHLLQLPFQLLKVDCFISLNTSYLCLMFYDKANDRLSIVFGNVFGLASEFALNLELFL